MLDQSAGTSMQGWSRSSVALPLLAFLDTIFSDMQQQDGRRLDDKVVAGFSNPHQSAAEKMVLELMPRLDPINVSEDSQKVTLIASRSKGEIMAVKRRRSSSIRLEGRNGCKDGPELVLVESPALQDCNLSSDFLARRPVLVSRKWAC